jgi:hypothetical protein
MIIYLVLEVEDDPDGYSYFGTKKEAMKHATDAIEDGNSGVTCCPVEVHKLWIPLKKEHILLRLNHPRTPHDPSDLLFSEYADDE